MARLIDADALLKKHCSALNDEYGCEYEFSSCSECLEPPYGCCCLEVRGEDIYNAPTIDAIPVEWLREKMQKPQMTCANPFGFVLAEWLDEQEAR